jgi:hypothetical protein
MLGTVVFRFTFLKHDWFVPTFAFLVGIWAACWWIGKGQEQSGGPVGFGRWLQAAGVAATIGFAAFTFLGPVESIIPWEPFSRARLAELRSGGATVLVDFSADWCMTCKLNLATAIETDKVKAAIESNKVVPLLADWTEESPEIKTMLESLQSKSIPVLAIFPAARSGESAPEPIILRDLITESQVLTAIKEKIGLNFEQFTRAVLLAQNEFAGFLKADDKERALILQALTGSHRFERLSMAAFERERQEQQAIRPRRLNHQTSHYKMDHNYRYMHRHRRRQYWLIQKR